MACEDPECTRYEDGYDFREITIVVCSCCGERPAEIEGEYYCPECDGLPD